MYDAVYAYYVAFDRLARQGRISSVIIFILLWLIKRTIAYTRWINNAFKQSHFSLNVNRQMLSVVSIFCLCQTIVTFQRSISHNFIHLWPSYCDITARCCWLRFDNCQMWANNIRRVALSAQNVAPNNVVTCCVEMLRSCGRGFRENFKREAKLALGKKTIELFWQSKQRLFFISEWLCFQITKVGFWRVEEIQWQKCWIRRGPRWGSFIKKSKVFDKALNFWHL